MKLFSEYNIREEKKDRKNGCKCNPTIKEMERDLNELHDLEDWSKLKIGYGVDLYGIVRRIVVTDDSKKYDAAKEFCMKGMSRFIPLKTIKVSKISETLEDIGWTISRQRKSERKFNEKNLEKSKVEKVTDKKNKM